MSRRTSSDPEVGLRRHCHLFRHIDECPVELQGIKPRHGLRQAGSMGTLRTDMAADILDTSPPAAFKEVVHGVPSVQGNDQLLALLACM